MEAVICDFQYCQVVVSVCGADHGHDRMVEVAIHTPDANPPRAFDNVIAGGEVAFSIDGKAAAAGRDNERSFDGALRPGSGSRVFPAVFVVVFVARGPAVVAIGIAVVAIGSAVMVGPTIIVSCPAIVAVGL